MNSGGLIIGGIILVFIIIILYSLMHKSAKKYYGKAEICHKKGEYYHEQGDEALAVDYYKESEFFRKKAEEMENVVQ